MIKKMFSLLLLKISWWMYAKTLPKKIVRKDINVAPETFVPQIRDFSGKWVAANLLFFQLKRQEDLLLAYRDTFDIDYQNGRLKKKEYLRYRSAIDASLQNLDFLKKRHPNLCSIYLKGYSLN